MGGGRGGLQEERERGGGRGKERGREGGRENEREGRGGEKESVRVRVRTCVCSMVLAPFGEITGKLMFT